MGAYVDLKIWFPRVMIALIGALLVSGCQTTPDAGTLARLEVYEVPHQRSEIHENQQVDERLETYAQQIHDGRLVKVSCGSLDGKEYAGIKFWNGLMLLPNAGAIKRDEVAAVGKFLLDSKQGKVFDYASLIVGAPQDQFINYQYPGSKTVFKVVRCQWNKFGEPNYVQVLDPIPGFELDYSKAERARHQLFSDAELRKGRIGIGHCSLRDTLGEVYYQPEWIFRVPVGLTIQKGDVVEVKLGEAEGSGRAGQLSEMTRSLGTREDFTRARNTAIFCK